MANHYLKTLNEEETRCGGCDKFPTEDGCECRKVSCCECGERNAIHSMEHPFKERDDWDDIPLCDKIHEFCCDRCCVEKNEEPHHTDEEDIEDRYEDDERN